MLTDIPIVMWKELREIVWPDGRFQGVARNVIVFVLLVGLFFPLQMGPSWVASWTAVQAACFPVMLVLNYAADSFAGERERHTLETLLASRLGDSAILLGKILAIVAYIWMLVIACQVVTIVGLNVSYRGGALLLYRPAILVSILAVSLLASLVFCSVGVLASLGAPTVRAAGQRMIAPFLVMLGLPIFVPMLIRKLHWEEAASRLAPADIVVWIGVACGLLTVVFVTVALERFKRERLILA